ncbi:DNA polymerase III subunit delta' [Sulfitobacter sp. F26169L]|uniref:DNA polymerase III subunit delta' n=1 Tax=Sulfitobacter sp. F26169L TaxID=2996015 RepID=UPI002260F0CB|nr:DNA polymerase III subunit delta' [Sulfitobacter sp. F26169L]MCX7566046.1 DNA polymerase III subunit delta' [Sulfitobacter sp. F26169L]
MSDEPPPQPERLDGAPHPRDTLRLIGQEAAQTAFVDAFNTGRLHHAWMLTGPRGVGKATLAWQIARFLLATPEPDDGGMFATQPATTLPIPLDHPIALRVASGGEGRIRNVTRTVNPTTKKLRQEIVADDIRALNGFFQMSAPDGGYRVVIIDDADQMNVTAANALLKMLEEPPARALLILISHQPSGLLPTIRSRCRTLPLRTLDAAEVAEAMAQADVQAANTDALAALSGGSVGGAMRLSLLGGAALYADLVALMGSLPRIDRAAALKLAEMAAARGGEAKRDLMFTLIDLLFSRLARTGVTGTPPQPQAAPNEAEILQRLSPNPHQARIWADLAGEIGARARHGIAVNLDPAALVLDTFTKMAKAAPR